MTLSALLNHIVVLVYVLYPEVCYILNISIIYRFHFGSMFFRSGSCSVFKFVQEVRKLTSLILVSLDFGVCDRIICTA